MSVPSVRRQAVARLVFGKGIECLRLENGGLIYEGQPHPVVEIDSIVSPAKVVRGLAWSRLVVETNAGEQLFRGFPGESLALFAAALNRELEVHVRQQLGDEHDAMRLLSTQVTRLLNGSEYARTSRVRPVLHAARDICSVRRGSLWDLYATEEQRTVMRALSDFVRNHEAQLAAANARYVTSQVAAYGTLFDTVERQPLTAMQRKACVSEEDNNLVLAGAGTGKTSTMMGRAGYLLASGKASSEQILMLAYGKKAADEMQQRMGQRLGTFANAGVPTAKTFHALGLEIIGLAEGRRPALSVLAEDSFALERFIDARLKLECSDPDYVTSVVEWCANRRYPYRNPFDFKSEQEYLEYVRTHEMRTLKGELVKSYEEVLVANFLHMNGIDYRYESKYMTPVSVSADSSSGDLGDASHRAYMPDFYLPAYGIYIEHFALGHALKAPPGWKDYEAGVAWKRDIHRTYGTRLLETRSHMRNDGVLEQCLEAMLVAEGVQLHPRPMSELLQELRKKGDLTYVTKPIGDFLTLLKQSDKSFEDVQVLGSQQEDSERFCLFFAMFAPIFEAYQKDLVSHGEIDFGDMIKRATEHVRSGTCQSPYRHIMVDEFQDISASRVRLIRALLEQVPESVFFAVGDDWQAIYRFSGSDITFTREFESTFGPTATTALDKTFRFNDRIGEVSAKFVLRNPGQIKKDIQSGTIVDEASVSLLPTSDDGIGLRLALKSIDRRRERADAVHATVHVLGRYNATFEQWKNPAEKRQLKADFPALGVEFMTIHAAKGREADYVIVLGLEMGRSGFPSEKPAEPLMELLLPPTEPYRFAEERRLLYVALTRARHRVYLVYEPTVASSFIKELVAREGRGTQSYDICSDEFRDERGAATHVPLVSCPRCETGALVARKGPYGSFVGCNRYPYCDYKEPSCPTCGSAMVRKAGMRVCASEGCTQKSPICPKCGAAMVKRTGTHGQFWGCSTYRSNGVNLCSGTIDIRSNRN